MQPTGMSNITDLRTKDEILLKILQTMQLYKKTRFNTYKRS